MLFRSADHCGGFGDSVDIDISDCAYGAVGDTSVVERELPDFFMGSDQLDQSDGSDRNACYEIFVKI